jgi:hypothetical protein
MAEPQPSKLKTRVRLPSPAPLAKEIIMNIDLGQVDEKTRIKASSLGIHLELCGRYKTHTRREYIDSCSVEELIAHCERIGKSASEVDVSPDGYLELVYDELESDQQAAERAIRSAQSKKSTNKRKEKQAEREKAELHRLLKKYPDEAQ